MTRRVFPAILRDCSLAIPRDCRPLILLNLTLVLLGMALGGQVSGETTPSVVQVALPASVPQSRGLHADWLYRTGQVAADRVAWVALAPAGERAAVAEEAAGELHQLAARVGRYSDGAAAAGVIEELAEALKKYAAGEPGALARIRAASAVRSRLMSGGQP